MTQNVKVCVLRIEGTNCEEEMARSFRLVGASPELVHLKQLIHSCPKDKRRDLGNYDLLALPGGFSAGDYVRAGAMTYDVVEGWWADAGESMDSWLEACQLVARSGANKPA